MSIEDTKLTREVGSVRELNAFLGSGWKLILTYIRNSGDKQDPRYVISWQTDEEPVIPELLDEWELNEIDKQRYR